jgi:hypothetical protein
MLILCLAGCTQVKDKKYDVTIKVKNNYGSEWIFTPDIKELSYEFAYTGEDMTFYIDSYKLADHPDWGDKWCGLTGEGANVFKQTMQYCPPNGLNKSYSGPVKEIGEYHICFEALKTSNLWNYRSVDFYITVV